jgi:multicomponent K+:H+ antiporter subunit E
MTGFMTRLVPQPIVSLVLAAVWLLLVNDVSAGNIVLGLAIGFLVPLLTSPYWPDRTLPRRPFGLVAYVLIVLWDVVLSNFHVARLVLFRRGESLKSRFVTVPIELQSAEAIAILSATITMTPGTVTADLSSDGSKLLVHCLDAEDPDAVVAGIKSRYERRLKEIFE